MQFSRIWKPDAPLHNGETRRRTKVREVLCRLLVSARFVDDSRKDRRNAWFYGVSGKTPVKLTH